MLAKKDSSSKKDTKRGYFFSLFYVSLFGFILLSGTMLGIPSNLQIQQSPVPSASLGSHSQDVYAQEFYKQEKSYDDKSYDDGGARGGDYYYSNSYDKNRYDGSSSSYNSYDSYDKKKNFAEIEKFDNELFVCENGIVVDDRINCPQKCPFNTPLEGVYVMDLDVCNIQPGVGVTCPLDTDLPNVVVTNLASCNIFEECGATSPLGASLGGTEVRVADPALCQLSVPPGLEVCTEPPFEGFVVTDQGVCDTLDSVQICEEGTDLEGVLTTNPAECTQYFTCQLGASPLADFIGQPITVVDPDLCSLLAECPASSPLGQSLGLGTLETVFVVDEELCQLDAANDITDFGLQQCQTGDLAGVITANPDVCLIDIPELIECESGPMIGQLVTDDRLCEAPNNDNICGPTTDLAGAYVDDPATDCELFDVCGPTTDLAGHIVIDATDESCNLPEVPVLDPNGDEDGDLLLNSWETDGIDSNGDGTIDFILSNANPLHKDLYVEVDFMEFHEPLSRGIANVIDAFDNAPLSNPDGINGINLHVDTDEEVTHQNTIDEAGLIAIRNTNFGTAAERADANSANIIDAKLTVFHYALFGHDQAAPNAGSSGNSYHIPNMEFVVTLGATDWGVDPATGHNVGSLDQQEGTFIHELGHNLDFGHGGGDGINCKPNYLSVMTYARQFSNILSDRPLDYSRSVIASLDEASLNENDGIGASEPPGLDTVYGPAPRVFTTAGNPENWNRDGDSTDNGVSSDINNFNFNDCMASPNQVLDGFDDWDNLLYITDPAPGSSLGTNTQINTSEPTSPLKTSTSDSSNKSEQTKELSIDDVKQIRVELLRDIESAINSLPAPEISALQQKLELKEISGLEKLLLSNKLDEAIAELNEIKANMTSSQLKQSSQLEQKVLPLIDNMIKALEKQK